MFSPNFVMEIESTSNNELDDDDEPREESPDIKHTPAHLASVFANILNADQDDIKDGKLPTSSKRSLAKIEKSKKRSKTNKNRDDGDSPSSKKKFKKGKTDLSSINEESNSTIKDYKEKRKWDNLNRTKPDTVVDRELERSLVRIATKGVVQLFNAIREHQARVGDAVTQSHTTTSKMEKNVKSIIKKDNFFDLVSSSTTIKSKSKSSEIRTVKKKEKKRSNKKSDEIKKEDEEDEDDESSKQWDVLRNDFLSTKDWEEDD